AFLAMNQVFGQVFQVSEAEAATLEAGADRAQSLAHQFIFDAQTHFVRDDFQEQGLAGLSGHAAKFWNPAIAMKDDLRRFKFENYMKEIFLDSDTDVALLSGGPFDDPKWLFLTNAQIAETRALINSLAGSKRLFAHSVITPGQAGWMDDVDEAIEVHKPDSWKEYTIGDPLSPKTQYLWRLDDEKLAYPFYEKAVKSGITKTCIHKGLLPADYEKSWPGVWEYATVNDLGKAAKDWPQLTFIMYHAALQPFLEDPARVLAEFESTGYIAWASDLAAIPQKFGVSNVYAEVGTAFANSAVSNPRFAAALIGTLVKGMGVDHVLWGTDSVWYGSPQWQIEAMRRLEIPADMQEKHGFAPLGGADSHTKNSIFGHNSARLYSLEQRVDARPFDGDTFAAIKREYQANGGLRSNKAYGYVHKVPA
ncbi:MAG: amidohydrolase family protein, partial [Alphaproteobacteria bacterium]